MITCKCKVACCVLLFTIIFWIPFLKAVLISQVVGEVKKEVVTSREVEIYFFIDQALFRSAKMTQINSLMPYNFPQELNSTLINLAVDLEARSFSVAHIDESVLQKKAHEVKLLLSHQSHWNELEVSSTEIRLAVERLLRAKKFFDFKIQSSIVEVSDEEAQIYYNKNQRRFANLSFNAIKKNIRTFLQKQQKDQRIDSWLQVIKKKYQVKNLL